jgi:hypothetical protein
MSLYNGGPFILFTVTVATLVFDRIVHLETALLIQVTTISQQIGTKFVWFIPLHMAKLLSEM